MRNFPHDKMLSVRHYESALSREDAYRRRGLVDAMLRDQIYHQITGMLANQVMVSRNTKDHVTTYQVDLVVLTPQELIALVNQEALDIQRRMGRDLLPDIPPRVVVDYKDLPLA